MHYSTRLYKGAAYEAAENGGASQVLSCGRVAFLGGGTCAGKTSIAKRLEDAYGVVAFSVDDRLEAYAAKAEQAGSVAARTSMSTDFERFWMRDPSEQLVEMLQFYGDVFPFVMEDLEKEASSSAQPVVAEGIAFMPALLYSAGVPADSCLFVTCERALHDQRYAQRDWPSLMLEGCSDPQRAFTLWMQRDELFSATVRDACAKHGYSHVSVDADTDYDLLVKQVAALFNLG